MNKKEQAAFDEAVTDMYAARALRWQDDKPEPMSVDEIKAEIAAGNAVEILRYGQPRKIFSGWSYNAYGEGYVSVLGHDGVYSYGAAYNGKISDSASQSGGPIYRTQADALRALRYDMTVKYARSLAKIDAQIKAVTV